MAIRANKTVTRKQIQKSPRAGGSTKQSVEQRRQLFCESYITNGGNATQAAITAGFSAKTAGSQGQRLLKNVDVARYIADRSAEVLRIASENTGLTVERTLREVARLAFFDPRDLFDEGGNLKPIHEMDDDTSAAIAGFEVVEICAASSDDGDMEPQSHGGALMRRRGGVVGHVKKIKHCDKNSALEKAMKHLKLYPQAGQVAPTGNIDARSITFVGVAPEDAARFYREMCKGKYE
jgi:phage terminase small subunit